MKNKKVLMARFHVGMTFVGNTVTTLHAGKHKADMELTPAGIFVQMADTNKKKAEYFVPFTNVLYSELIMDEPKSK